MLFRSFSRFNGVALAKQAIEKGESVDQLRGQIMKQWKKLGLKAEPDTGNNGVHASASPFEGLAERMNWLGYRCSGDSYCNALMRAGVKEATIKAWSVDPQVKIDPAGKKGSLFDALEDMDLEDCVAKAVAMAAALPGATSLILSAVAQSAASTPAPCSASPTSSDLSFSSAATPSRHRTSELPNALMRRVASSSLRVPFAATASTSFVA